MNNFFYLETILKTSKINGNLVLRQYKPDLLSKFSKLKHMIRNYRKKKYWNK